MLVKQRMLNTQPNEFNEHTPSLNDIKSAISCFNEEKITTSELKYIKIAKKNIIFIVL